MADKTLESAFGVCRLFPLDFRQLNNGFGLFVLVFGIVSCFKLVICVFVRDSVLNAHHSNCLWLY